MIFNLKQGIYKFLHRLRRFSIRNKIVLFFVGFIFIIISISGVYIYTRIYNILRTETYQNVQMVTKEDAKNVDQSFQVIENTALGITASEVIYGWLNNPDSFNMTNSDYYLKQDALNNQVNNALIYNNAWALNLLSTISIYQNNTGISYTYTNPLPLQKMEAENNQAFNYFTKINQGDIFTSLKIYNNTIYYYRRLDNLNDTRQTMTILVGVNETTISDEYKDLVKNGEMDSYIVDQQGIVISSNKKTLLGKPIEKSIFKKTNNGFQQVTIDNNKNIATLVPMDYTGFTLVTVIPESSISNQILNSMRYFFIIAAVFTFAFLILGLFISVKSTKFIKDILIAMNNVRNKNYNTKMPDYKDETLNEMSQSFNSMTSEINHLIRDVYEKQLLLKEMDIKFLQYQMNPHFLFNILLTIEMKAKFLKDETIYKMVRSLSILLRTSIYTDTSAKIKIRQEMELVKFYLYLQEIRFEDKLSYVILCSDDSIYESYLPKLTIEPIIENAIVHGMENKIGKTEIKIELVRENEDIVVIIEDDGVGFDVNKVFKETIDNVTKRDPARDKLGIKSTDQRLKLIYGESYGLKICSNINVGTKVTIRIPEDRNDI